MPCKSCPAKVICHVLTGTCLATYVPQIPVVIDRNDEGSSCSRGYKNGNCSNSKIYIWFEMLVFSMSKEVHVYMYT